MAIIKDYYRILDIKSSATAAEIKKAYRRLAMKYHPDHNKDDALAENIFAELAEAYTVLSDDAARKEYNYSRYLTAGQEYKRPAEAIDKLIIRISKINAQIKTADPFRLNKDALLHSIKQILPEDISLLLGTKENLLKQFLEIVFETAKRLSSHQTKQLILLLQPLYVKNEWLQQKLNTLLYQQQKNERWEKYKIVLAVLLAIILCMIIFFAASK